ncbi:MAG TPA: alpha/beta hydrolase [Acidimicrobiales bacterium]|jgi:pimeloyl-ACP methyl ester carboxylesterase|nr:alpha/beta hydrolase [Acidimicrobiales bacterium]
MLASIERGSGPAVVLLHGQPGSGSSWDPVTRRLERDFRVLAPDRIGYGASVGEARGLADNAELVAALIRATGAAPATVVAHSWAGGVGVLLADRHPGMVRSLVLVGAACTPDSLNALDRWLNLPFVGDALTVAGLLGIGEVLPRIRRFVRYAPPRYRDQLAALLPDQGVLGGEPGALGRHKRTFMIEQRAIVDEMPRVTAALGGLELPVAVVHGEWDVVVPPRAAVSLARSIPGADLILLPRAGHFVVRDDPDSLVDVIRRTAPR